MKSTSVYKTHINRKHKHTHGQTHFKYIDSFTDILYYFKQFLQMDCNLTSFHDIFNSYCQAYIREAVKINRIDIMDPEIGNWSERVAFASGAT